MKKRIVGMAGALLLLFLLSGCSAIGRKTASMAVIYGVTAVLSLALLLGYCVLRRRWDRWFLLLLSSVTVVNIGYLALSLSQTVEAALWANRISYLGSVFLPLAMLMILLNTTGIHYRKRLPTMLTAVNIAVFLVAASPGYLNIYYKSVSIATINGVKVLQKEYGSWHGLYLVFLVLYFAAMIAVIGYAAVKQKPEPRGHAAILAIAVGCNLGVWLLEQLVQIDFEFLSVSYVISELFLLGLDRMIRENETRLSVAIAEIHHEQDAKARAAEEERLHMPAITPSMEARCAQFAASIPGLTQTERAVYERYVAGKTTKEIMAELGIKENTLKYHNKNLYGKLGVSSRKELMEIARTLKIAESREHEA